MLKLIYTQETMVWNDKIRSSVRKNRLKGVLILGLTVFLSLSFFSYNPHDPSLNSFGLSLKVANYCGFVGASLADMFYQLFGFSSWFFVFWGFLLSFKFVTNRFQESLLNSSLMFMLFLLSFSSLGELHFSQISFFSQQVSLGGALGGNPCFQFKALISSDGNSCHFMVCFFTGFYLLWAVLLSFFFIFAKKTSCFCKSGFNKSSDSSCLCLLPY